MDTQANAINENVPEIVEGTSKEAQNEAQNEGKKEEAYRQIGMAMPVPGYPFELIVQVVLTQELKDAVDAETDETLKNRIQSNILTNMLLASLGVAINEGKVEKRTESGLIIP